MKRKTVSIIISLLMVLYLVGCDRSMSNEKVEKDNLSTKAVQHNDATSADNTDYNAISTEVPSIQNELSSSESSVHKRFSSGSPVEFYYDENVLVLAYTDKLVDEFFKMVEEESQHDASIEMRLNYDFIAKLEYWPSDTINNMPYVLKASYENKKESYYAESMNPFGEIASGGSPKIFCMRNNDTLFLICKAHGFPSKDAETASVDMIFISPDKRFESENFYIRRNFDSSSTNFSRTLLEGADNPISIPLGNDLPEFKLIDRYNPVSEDYLLLEYNYDISTQLHIISFDEYGLPIECVTVCDYKDPNTEDYIAKDINTFGNKEMEALQFFDEDPPEFRRYLSKPFLTAKQMHH